MWYFHLSLGTAIRRHFELLIDQQLSKMYGQCRSRDRLFLDWLDYLPTDFIHSDILYCSMGTLAPALPHFLSLYCLNLLWIFTDLLASSMRTLFLFDENFKKCQASKNKFESDERAHFIDSFIHSSREIHSNGRCQAQDVGIHTQHVIQALWVTIHVHT